MKVFYTIYQALESIMEEIETYEREMKEMKSLYARDQQRVKMLWAFERGINMLLLAKAGEIDKETYDWFLGRTKKNPFDSQKEALLKIKESNINKVDK